jgi:hypothetical protein
MSKARAMPDQFAVAYPHIASWVGEHEGWIEVGADEYSRSFVRAVYGGGFAWEGKPVYGGGFAWEGKPTYPSLDKAFQALDAGIAAWLHENRPWSAEEIKRPLRRGRGKRP